VEEGNAAFLRSPLSSSAARVFLPTVTAIYTAVTALTAAVRGKKYYTEPIKRVTTVYRSVFILFTNRSYHVKKP
jgi:hypothetical protein